MDYVIKGIIIFAAWYIINHTICKHVNCSKKIVCAFEHNNQYVQLGICGYTYGQIKRKAKILKIFGYRADVNCGSIQQVKQFPVYIPAKNIF